MLHMTRRLALHHIMTHMVGILAPATQASSEIGILGGIIPLHGLFKQGGLS
jgi:hypothetical protein